VGDSHEIMRSRGFGEPEKRGNGERLLHKAELEEPTSCVIRSPRCPRDPPGGGTFFPFTLTPAFDAR